MENADNRKNATPLKRGGHALNSMQLNASKLLPEEPDNDAVAEGYPDSNQPQ